MQKYVTYGLGNKFNPDKLVTDLTCSIGKPASAWWGSPINTEFGWKDWCKSENFIPSRGLSFEEYFSDNNKIVWTLKEGSKILLIDSIYDLNDFQRLDYIVEGKYDSWEFDFKKILNDGYTAIQLNDAGIGHYFMNRLELLMNSWDCESIVVLDPSKIVILEGE